MESDARIRFEANLSGTKPLTDEPSKTVMIAAERRDTIRIEEVVQSYDSNPDPPVELSVIRRVTKYYGPELVLYSESEGSPRNYRMVAPGPSSHLHLWKADVNEVGERESYSLLAEVKASLLDGTYEMCPDCGNPFKTRRHERLAAIGRCPNCD